MNENEQKFLDFYDKSATKIYRYVYFRVGSEEVAQDLASEAFLRTWRYLKEGKFIGNLSAMTYEVCRNLISDYFRINRKLPISLEEISELNLNISESGLVRETEIKADLDLIRRHIKLIKDDYQDLIIWRYIEGLNTAEIAQILDKSEGSIRTSLSRALAALKKAVED